MPLDFHGDMRIDLLGHIPNDEKNLYVWRNVWERSNGTILYDTYVPVFFDNLVLTLFQDRRKLTWFRMFHRKST